MPIISDDKLKITINLKENIYFHDGTQFDAESTSAIQLIGQARRIENKGKEKD